MNQLARNQYEHTELQSFFARLETDRSLSRQQSKQSLQMKIFNSVFQAVEQISPASAKQWGEKLFFTPMQRRLRTEDNELLLQASEKYIEFNGEELPILRWGNSNDPAILLVHGWGGRPTDFGKWIPALLDEGFRVISAEGPAHGSSGKSRTSLPELAEFFGKVIEHTENLYGYIGHSLGGSVIMLGMQNGIPPKPSVFVNTPADPDGIIDVFLNKINGSKEIGKYIKDQVAKQFGREFNEFSAINTAKSMPRLPVLIVHDRYDTEAPIYHFEELRKVIPWSEFMITDNLGHTKILQSEKVIKKGVEFMSIHQWS